MSGGSRNRWAVRTSARTASERVLSSTKPERGRALVARRQGSRATPRAQMGSSHLLVLRPHWVCGGSRLAVLQQHPLYCGRRGFRPESGTQAEIEAGRRDRRVRRAGAGLRSGLRQAVRRREAAAHVGGGAGAGRGAGLAGSGARHLNRDPQARREQPAGDRRARAALSHDRAVRGPARDLREEAAAQSDAAAKKEIRYKVASIFELEIKDDQKAIEAYRGILADHGDELQASGPTLDRIYQATSQWKELAQVIQRDCALVPDDPATTPGSSSSSSGSARSASSTSTIRRARSINIATSSISTPRIRERGWRSSAGSATPIISW